jgi:LacI family transcriptional regulator
MITLKELAKKLNVSISTVSKALNGSSEISDDTIKRVKEVAEIYNYTPNKVALSLKNSKTKTIGVIIPSILNHFFAKVLYGIEKEASKLGYSLITCISNELYDKEVKSLNLLANGSVDGFIMSIAEETQIQQKSDHLKSIIDRKLPIVMFDRTSEKIDCDKVIIDDFQATYKVTKHLLEEGRQQIILINNIEELNVGKLRTKGFLKAIEDDTSYKSEPIVVNISKRDDLETAIDAIFDTYKTIDGIIAIDNVSGVIALNKAQKRGISIPQALSIIGFSDENVLQFTTPKLSTVSQHSQEIGATSVRMLVDRLENKEKLKETTKIIDVSLHLRGTTK